MTMKLGSLFSGSGIMDLAFERSGFDVRWQVEKDKSCLKILRSKFENSNILEDILEVNEKELEKVDVIIGGDPCPYRSRASKIHGNEKTIDFWPEFRRILHVVRPVWVCRENVVAEDTDRCWGQLQSLGYNAIVLEFDSASVTGASRPREYLCGVLERTGVCPGEVFSQPQGGGGGITKNHQKKIIASCLTAKPRRYDSSENYILEDGWGDGERGNGQSGIRILCPEERERLQGIPAGWTAGLPLSARERITGNAVTYPVVKWIAERIARSMQAVGPGLADE